MNPSDKGLSSDGENSGAKRNSSPKTSGDGTPDEKHPQTKRMHAPTTTADERIDFSDSEYRAEFIPASVLWRMERDYRRDARGWWSK